MATIRGERRFDAPPRRVYDLLTDPDVVAAALPGVRDVRVDDADHWRAQIKPPLPLAPSLTLRFAVLDRRPPDHARLHARGGGADITSFFDLEPDGDGTLMRWRTDLEFAGLLGRLAGPGLEPMAERQAARMLDAVERRL